MLHWYVRKQTSYPLKRELKLYQCIPWACLVFCIHCLHTICQVVQIRFNSSIQAAFFFGTLVWVVYKIKPQMHKQGRQCWWHDFRLAGWIARPLAPHRHPIASDGKRLHVPPRHSHGFWENQHLIPALPPSPDSDPSVSFWSQKCVCL